MSKVIDLIPQKYKDELGTLIGGYEGISGYNPLTKKYYPVQEKADKKGDITIGRGHLLTENDKKTNRFKHGLTLTEVNNLFAEDLSSRAEHVYHNILEIKDPTTVNWQLFIGILSSYFNCPSAWNTTSSPYRYLKENKLTKMCSYLILYTRSNGEDQYGLFRRRCTEALYILKGLILFGNKDFKQEQRLYDELRKYIKFSLTKYSDLRKGIK